MKKSIRSLFIVLLLLFLATPVFAQTGTEAWLNGYIVDDDVPILKNNGKIYVPVDKIVEYDGLYTINKKEGKWDYFIFFETSERNNGNTSHLIMGDKQVFNEDDELVITFKEPPFRKNNHVYLTIEDARDYLGDPLTYDDKNNVLALSNDYTPNATPKTIKIIVNGKEVPSKYKVFPQNNRTMVPLRFIAEAVGGDVYWHPELTDGMQGVTIGNPEDEYMALTMWLYKCGAHESELFYRNDTFPVIRGESTYVPLRFIADYLGLKVKWNQQTNTVVLTKGGDRNMSKYEDEMMDDLFIQFTKMKNPEEGVFSRIFL